MSMVIQTSETPLTRGPASDLSSARSPVPQDVPASQNDLSPLAGKARQHPTIANGEKIKAPSDESEKPLREKPMKIGSELWRPEDLVKAQHFNAISPHPNSLMAKLMLAIKATRTYESLNRHDS